MWYAWLNSSHVIFRQPWETEEWFQLSIDHQHSSTPYIASQTVKRHFAPRYFQCLWGVIRMAAQECHKSRLLVMLTNADKEISIRSLHTFPENFMQIGIFGPMTSRGPTMWQYKLVNFIDSWPSMVEKLLSRVTGETHSFHGTYFLVYRSKLIITNNIQFNPGISLPTVDNRHVCFCYPWYCANIRSEKTS